MNAKSFIDLEKYTLLRREFHKIPEIGYKEYKTSKLILDTLNNFPNFEKYSRINKVGETGMFIDINGIGPASDKFEKLLISLRADMDGLPFEEENNFPYRSIHPNMIHGCGHDGHITMLIATIEYYLSKIEKIPKNFCVRFLFQPAEEGLFGAKKMIEGGCLKNVDEIYGLHNLPTFAVGEIGVIKGTIMARIDIFHIDIHGKGGHSSVPHLTHNPINTGVQIVQALNQISSQEVDSKDRHVIGIGCFRAGDTFNVIPENGYIKGTIRGVSNETSEFIMKRIEEVCSHIGSMNNSEVKVKAEFNNCTVNHDKPTELVEEIVQKYFKLETHDLPVMASEDFAYYLEQTPGCFFMLGVKDEEFNSLYLHTPKYNFNDKAIRYGVEAFIRIIEAKAKVNLI